jgi:hypothetical protein
LKRIGFWQLNEQIANRIPVILIKKSTFLWIWEKIGNFWQIMFSILIEEFRNQ